MDGLKAGHLIADKGYDSDAIVEQAKRQGMEAVIPPRRNRKVLREYDPYLYQLRHLVENAFLHLKRWRGIATRYAKNTASYLAAVHIRCIALWSNISCLHYLASTVKHLARNTWSSSFKPNLVFSSLISSVIGNE